MDDDAHNVIRYLEGFNCIILNAGKKKETNWTVVMADGKSNRAAVSSTTRQPKASMIESHCHFANDAAENHAWRIGWNAGR